MESEKEEKPNGLLIHKDLAEQWANDIQVMNDFQTLIRDRLKNVKQELRLPVAMKLKETIRTLSSRIADGQEISINEDIQRSLDPLKKNGERLKEIGDDFQERMKPTIDTINQASELLSEAFKLAVKEIEKEEANKKDHETIPLAKMPTRNVQFLGDTLKLPQLEQRAKKPGEDMFLELDEEKNILRKTILSNLKDRSGAIEQKTQIEIKISEERTKEILVEIVEGNDHQLYWDYKSTMDDNYTFLLNMVASFYLDNIDREDIIRNLLTSKKIRISAQQMHEYRGKKLNHGYSVPPEALDYYERYFKLLFNTKLSQTFKKSTHPIAKIMKRSKIARVNDEPLFEGFAYENSEGKFDGIVVGLGLVARLLISNNSVLGSNTNDFARLDTKDIDSTTLRNKFHELWFINKKYGSPMYEVPIRFTKLLDYVNAKDSIEQTRKKKEYIGSFIKKVDKAISFLMKEGKINEVKIPEINAKNWKLKDTQIVIRFQYTEKEVEAARSVEDKRAARKKKIE